MAASDLLRLKAQALFGRSIMLTKMVSLQSASAITINLFAPEAMKVKFASGKLDLVNLFLILKNIQAR